MSTPCPDLDSLYQACDGLLDGARRTVDIFAPDLDPVLLDREPPLQALASLTRVSRFSRIRLLFHDAGPAIRKGHRLIHLARRFPSYIQLRRTAREHQQDTSAWLVVDQRHALWRPDYMLMEGAHALPDEPGRATQLVRRFEQWWQYSETEPGLRELHL